MVIGYCKFISSISTEVLTGNVCIFFGEKVKLLLRQIGYY
jgi:hypothetical protein